jgi:OPA family glycerol-3-phosphate transporter-like MFS transporter 1/2
MPQGVIEFSVSLFFSKLVCYMFLYWLPMYIKNNTHLSSEYSAYMSVPFDVGGILGAVIAGFAADRTKCSALTCIVMLVVAIPSLFAYMELASYSIVVNIMLQCFVGAVVNGPYCLITTAVSAELGNSLKNSHAMATVTAIIDGTGSIGAAVGPLLVGLLSVYGWDVVFYIAMVADLISMCFLFRIGRNEYRKIQERRRANVSS